MNYQIIKTREELSRHKFNKVFNSEVYSGMSFDLGYDFDVIETFETLEEAQTNLLKYCSTITLYQYVNKVFYLEEYAIIEYDNETGDYFDILDIVDFKNEDINKVYKCWVNSYEYEEEEIW